MAHLVYWCFALALIPFALDLILRLSTVLGNRIALHQTQLSDPDQRVCFNLHSHLSGDAWPTVKPADICHHR